jgi:hypothetical protein
MIITTIKLSQEINIMGRPTWVGFDGTITEGEDEIKGLMEMQDKVNKFAAEADKAMPKPSWIAKKKDVSEAVNAVLESIEKSKTDEELQSLWLISKGNLVLSEAFKTKQKELNDAK